MNENAAVKDVEKLKQIFEQANINFWLDSGTLLGLVRDGHLIEWDVDVDLGMWYHNIEAVVSVLPIIKKHGFQATLNRREGYMGITRTCSISINLFRKTNGYAWIVFPIKTHKSLRLLQPLPGKLEKWVTGFVWYLMAKRHHLTYWVVPTKYFERFSKIMFHDLQFNIPCNVEAYLTYRYGSNWKIPNKNWVWMRDDGAIRN